jgi:hypothetical protein
MVNSSRLLVSFLLFSSVPSFAGLVLPQPVLSGQPGGEVGWGFTITSTPVDTGDSSITPWLVITGATFSLDAGVNPVGVFTPFIQNVFQPVGPDTGNGEVNPWSQAFLDGATQTGIGSYLINDFQSPGDFATGQIVLTYDEFTVSPNDPDFDPTLDTLATGLTMSANAEVDVTGDVSAVPEPGSAWLIMAAMAVCLGWRFRRALPMLFSSLLAGISLQAGVIPGSAPVDYNISSTGIAEFHASNAANRFEATFTKQGAMLVRGKQSATLRLGGAGYGDRVTGFPAASITADQASIEYMRGSVREWYRNTSNGLEQGFTIARRPGIRRAGEDLTLSLDITGSLRAAQLDSGSILLMDPAGTTALRYSGLKAWDADGTVLKSRMEANGGRIELLVDDVAARYPITVDPVIQEAKLLGSDAAGGDQEGITVAISGNTAVVGAPRVQGSQIGSAYVFVQNNGVWSQQAELASPAGTQDAFGYSVAIDGNTMIVGAPLLNSLTGAAYVFVRSGTTWSLQSTLTAGDAAAFDASGFQVALQGDTALVGAVYQNGQQGAAYVYSRSGTSWTQQAKLIASDGQPGDTFSAAISLDSNTALIGSPGHASATGAAYVYVRNGSNWTLQRELTATDGQQNYRFGYGVGVKGDTAVVGSPSTNPQGSAYIYTRSGTVWIQQTELIPVGSQPLDQVGLTVGLTDNLVVLGNKSQESGIPGGAYVFAGGGASWTQVAYFAPSDAAANDNIGTALAVNGNQIILGASGQNGNTGAAYAYLVPAVTVQSNPAGRSFTASGTGCPSGPLLAPYTFLPGISCSVQFTSPDTNNPAARYTFVRWEDDGDTDNPRTLQAISGNDVFTADFSSQYLLTINANPAAGGQVTGGGWYALGTNATVSATASTGFVFSGFSGDVTGSASPVPVAMNGPKTITATFLPQAPANMSALITSKTGTTNARQWNVTVSNSGPGVAYGAQLNGLVLNQTFGAACAPIRLSPSAYPVSLGNMAGGGNVSVTALFDFSACPANARFTAVLIYTANSGISGNATALTNQLP